jgi:hypothetical protein
VSDFTDGALDGIASVPASGKAAVFGGMRDCNQLVIAGPAAEWLEGAGW